MTGAFELGLERSDFDQTRQVTTGTDRDNDMRNLDAENRHILFLHAKAVDIRNFVPGLERYDEINALLEAHTFDAKHRRHVDDADAANLHVVARDLGARAHDFAAIEQHHLGNVVGHQAVAALNERQDRLAFPDATLAANDHTDAKDIDHAPHFA